MLNQRVGIGSPDETEVDGEQEAHDPEEDCQPEWGSTEAWPWTC